MTATNGASRSTRPRAQNVGIKGIQVYFPRTAISEADLEQHDGVSAGKYTIGFGQEYMAYVSDLEDIGSFCLNATSSLIKSYNIDPNAIGRLEVGTETIIDKAKAIKTVLMDLFPDNDDIEGVDSKNACYGATAALFNAVNWVESSSWDGRDAIVVAADIAIYAAGAARPVGGAGAVALWIGPDAPIALEPTHGSHMSNTWDFYKPDLSSEYPTVDGPWTITAYLGALEKAYANYRRKLGQLGATLNVDSFDFCLFHAPYGKLVQKGFARLLFNDWKNTQLLADQVPQGTDPHASVSDKVSEKTFMTLSKPRFDAKVAPTTMAGKRLGNTYSASLYMGLASLISSKQDADLLGKTLSMFSYGSGCASTFFAAKIVGDLSHIRHNLNLKQRLESVKVNTVQDYLDAIELREKFHAANDYTPQGSKDDLWDKAFYLEQVDKLFRRKYATRK